MVVRTRSERVDHSRRMVLELLDSSVDLSLTSGVDEWLVEYHADSARHGADAASVARRSVMFCRIQWTLPVFKKSSLNSNRAGLR